ncbi:MAG: carboxypeptidase regulatory-like domain-containing protein, partial [Clostridia bacterium]|nr:carboxypeptidase regulatory-like domain-containing protein [Clostridia bacterium]
LLFIGIYAFYDAQNVNDSGRLDDEIVEVASRSGITSESDNFSLDELKKINSEIVGWVKINDTTIDYPLVQAKNNDKYLARDYKGDYATAGTPFVDYRNNKMADPLTVIYGHRMKDGIMFSDITRFAEKWYFDRHQTGTLYTDEGKYKLELLGFAVLNLGETDIYNVNTYKKNSGKMIVSNGTAKNATIGQSIEVERDKTYYFSGFYVNMNSEGVTPKVVYTTVEGKTAVAPVEFFYDPDRFFFEGAFKLPDDANSMRGNATVKFLLDNGDKGQAYISDIGVYEEGKYENLFKNADFSNNFTQWQSNPNYTLSKYDASVFVFYYDDSAFDDGDWSGTAADMSVIKGDITGQILDGDGLGFAGVRVVLLPGRITVKTDADGYYRFKDLKPGEYSLYVRTPKGEEMFVRTVTVEAGMATGVSAITLAMAEDDEIDDIEYDTDSANYGIVCGYLFDANGKPLKGQKLYLGNVGTVTTKAKGVFQFNDVPPGEYDIYTKLDDGSIHIFKRVKVVAGKGKIYKIKMPAEAETGFFADLSWIWIAAIAVGGVLVLGGAAFVIVLILKKKQKS